MPSGKHFLKNKATEIIGERIELAMNQNFPGDIRGEEACGLLPPLQESSNLQGDSELQGGRRRP